MKWKKKKNLKKLFFAAVILDHLWAIMFKMRPLLFITFPHGFWISKNFGRLTSGSGGKNTFKRYLKSEQIIKKIHKKRCSPRQFSNLSLILSTTFPQGFWISKNFRHPILGSGKKRRLDGTPKVNTRTHGQTDTRTEILTYRKHQSRGPMLWKL